MAEAFGLAVGTLSLATLFSSCIEIADYIQLAHQFEKDHEAACVKFYLLKTRLENWGHAMHVSGIEAQTLCVRTLDEHNALVAQRCLAAIKRLLQDADGLEQKYGLRCRSESAEMATDSTNSEITGNSQLRAVISPATKDRQRASLGRKVVWAFRDKKSFDSLIMDFTFLINELEKIPSSHNGHFSTSFSNRGDHCIQQHLTSSDRESIGSSIGVDQSTTGTQPEPQLLPNLEAVFYRNKIGEHAKVVQDVSASDRSVRRAMRMSENMISGRARVYQGTVSSTIMQQFWE